VLFCLDFSHLLVPSCLVLVFVLSMLYGSLSLLFGFVVVVELINCLSYYVCGGSCGDFRVLSLLLCFFVLLLFRLVMVFEVMTGSYLRRSSREAGTRAKLDKTRQDVLSCFVFVLFCVLSLVGFCFAVVVTLSSLL
jgi:hypothetical protein